VTQLKATGEYFGSCERSCSDPRRCNPGGSQRHGLPAPSRGLQLYRDLRVDGAGEYRSIYCLGTAVIRTDGALLRVRRSAAAGTRTCCRRKPCCRNSRRMATRRRRRRYLTLAVMAVTRSPPPKRDGWSCASNGITRPSTAVGLICRIRTRRSGRSMPRPPHSRQADPHRRNRRLGARAKYP
jgi:hypothetical protein